MTETHKTNGTLLLRDHLFRSPTRDCGETSPPIIIRLSFIWESQKYWNFSLPQERTIMSSNQAFITLKQQSPTRITTLGPPKIQVMYNNYFIIIKTDIWENSIQYCVDNQGVVLHGKMSVVLRAAREEAHPSSSLFTCQGVFEICTTHCI